MSETISDKNSYGFRPYRSCADAIEQCFRSLAMKSSSQWILEGDIKSCFDKINHEFLTNNILMDKKILSQWLKTGFVYKHQWYESEAGTPQGGVASPTLANMVLDGMEKLIKSITNKNDKVNLVRYADDFIITGNCKELLEYKIKPAIQYFLSERGLTLSEEKTHITNINDGFNFLGFNIRKYTGKLLIKPSIKSVKTFLNDIQEVIKHHTSSTTLDLLIQLNPKIRGWANYYKHVVAKEIFNFIDDRIFQKIWRWCKRRHPSKCSWWVKRRYFTRQSNRDWIFSTKVCRSSGEWKTFSLFKASYIPIKRHIKIKAEANLYDTKYKTYFEQRLKKNNVRNLVS